MQATYPIGMTLFRPTSQLLLRSIQQAEKAGVPMVWIPSEPVGFDGMTTLAIAAAQTDQISLGTGIAVTYNRHPLTLANQALAIEEFAPQRFRLGIGVSHPFVVERMYGVPFQKPLAYLREYVKVLRDYLWEGSVQFQGKYFSVNAPLPPPAQPPRTPIVLAAVQQNMFKLAGEISDGAMVSWGLLPYMKSVALPAMREGAAQAGRPKPPLIASAPLVLDTDFARVRQAAYRALGRYVQMPVYQKLFADAGFPLTAEGLPSDELIHEMFLYGDESAITAKLASLYEAGVDEVQVAVYPSQNQISEEQAAMEIIGQFAQRSVRV